MFQMEHLEMGDLKVNQNIPNILMDFSLLFHFYTPWKYQKIDVFCF